VLVSQHLENFVKHRRRDIKIFSTDDVSLTRTKDPNLYKQGSSELNLKKLESYINVGKGSFIYDTTGVQKLIYQMLLNTHIVMDIRLFSYI
jgi:hypothetical protein